MSPVTIDQAPALSSIDYWQQASSILAHKDKKLGRIINAYTGECLIGGRNAYETAARAIVGQQISVKAAASIWAKLEKRFAPVNAEKIARCRLNSLRTCGLSQSKANYLKNVAQFFITHKIKPSYWKRISAAEAKKQLMEIKGVGEWTWQMFAIFYLKYPDILPLGDLGLVNAIQNIYNNGKPLDKAKLLSISARWQPWRTVATWYLWRSIDPEPISY